MIKVDESDPVGELEPSFPFRDVSIRRGVDVKEYYNLGQEIGRGKFGTVYRCEEKKSGLVLAAKFVGIARRQDRKNVEREVEIMRTLQHPRLIQLYDAFESQSVMCVVLELIEGGELFERVIDDDFILTEKACAVFMRQICEGVEFIHSHNIIHLDLKPENILCLTKTGNRIKIIDFGLARRHEPDKKLQVLFGTPEFVAPEVVNFEQITFATDMWSLGVICYVLLSGLSPFMGETDVQTMANVTIAQYDFDDEAFLSISEDAKDFISKLLLKDKEARLTASQCVTHPWLRRKTPPPPPSLSTTKENLKNYIDRCIPTTPTPETNDFLIKSQLLFLGVDEVKEEHKPVINLPEIVIEESKDDNDTSEAMVVNELLPNATEVDIKPSLYNDNVSVDVSRCIETEETTSVANASLHKVFDAANINSKEIPPASNVLLSKTSDFNSGNSKEPEPLPSRGLSKSPDNAIEDTKEPPSESIILPSKVKDGAAMKSKESSPISNFPSANVPNGTKRNHKETSPAPKPSIMKPHDDAIVKTNVTTLSNELGSNSLTEACVNNDDNQLTKAEHVDRKVVDTAVQFRGDKKYDNNSSIVIPLLSTTLTTDDATALNLPIKGPSESSVEQTIANMKQQVSVQENADNFPNVINAILESHRTVEQEERAKHLNLSDRVISSSTESISKYKSSESIQNTPIQLTDTRKPISTFVKERRSETTSSSSMTHTADQSKHISRFSTLKDGRNTFPSSSQPFVADIRLNKTLSQNPNPKIHGIVLGQTHVDHFKAKNYNSKKEVSEFGSTKTTETKTSIQKSFEKSLKKESPSIVKEAETIWNAQRQLRSTTPWFSELNATELASPERRSFDRRSSDISCFLHDEEDSDGVNLAEEIRKLSARLFQMSNREESKQEDAHNNNRRDSLPTTSHKRDPISQFLANHGVVPSRRPKFRFSNLNRDVPIGSPPPPSNLAYYMSHTLSQPPLTASSGSNPSSPSSKSPDNDETQPFHKIFDKKGNTIQNNSSIDSLASYFKASKESHKKVPTFLPSK